MCVCAAHACGRMCVRALKLGCFDFLCLSGAEAWRSMLQVPWMLLQRGAKSDQRTLLEIFVQFLAQLV